MKYPAVLFFLLLKINPDFLKAFIDIKFFKLIDVNIILILKISLKIFENDVIINCPNFLFLNSEKTRTPKKATL